MFIVSTTEIRWFYPGLIPGQVLAWLKAKEGLYEDQPPRTDNYLLLKAQENLGIKLREGRIEIKKRTADHSDFTAPGKSGRVESWIKWSFRAEQGPGILQDNLRDQAHWIAVQKNRRVQKYAMDENQSVIPYPSTGFPSEGVVLECAELLIQSQTWWTLAIECFGPSEKVYNNLLSVIPRMMKDAVNFQLSEANSCGYPEWISKLSL